MSQLVQDSKATLLAWRQGLLAQIGQELTLGSGGVQDPRQWSVQGDVPFPSGSEVAYYDNGLNFALRVRDQTVAFSLWVQMGEVRIGVKVPLAMASTETIRSKLASVYNGQPCERVRVSGSTVLFDWIWADRDFAGFLLMVDALSSELLTAVLVDRIAANMRNIYLAVMDTLTEGVSAALPGSVQVLGAAAQYPTIWVLGDAEPALAALTNLGGQGRVLRSKGKCHEVEQRLPKGVPGLSPGELAYGGLRCQVLTDRQASGFGLE